MVVVRGRFGGGDGVRSDEVSRFLVGCWLLDLGRAFPETSAVDCDGGLAEAEREERRGVIGDKEGDESKISRGKSVDEKQRI